MRVQLRDLAPGTEYAIQFRSNNGEEVSEWSQVQRFTTTNDTIPPSQPKNLSWFDSGNAFVGQWDKVTTQATNPPTPLLDFRHYRCNVSDGTVGADYFVTGEKFVYTKEMNESDFGMLKNTLTLTVRAVDMTYNESLPISFTANPLNPPVPSAPVIGNYLGALEVRWDGKDANGSNMPTNLAFVEVHVSTINGFTPNSSTFKTRLLPNGSATTAVITDIPYDQIVFVRLVAVNLLNKRSNPSAQGTGSRKRLSGLEIENGAISVDQINFTARDIGGPRAFYQTSEPLVAESIKDDIWYDTDDKYTTYRFNGATWVPAPEIGVISGTKIVAGTLTSDAVGTNLLIASRANIANAIIDEAHITSVNAAAITTGALRATNRIIAGPENDNHAEMTSNGFYVMAPDPMNNNLLVARIRMGNGQTDFFSIMDPNTPEETVASITENGVASFQDLYVNADPRIKTSDESVNGDRIWADLIRPRARGVVAKADVSVSGLNATGAVGIREEYGLATFAFDVEAGRVYQVWCNFPQHFVEQGGRVEMRLRQEMNAPASITSTLIASNFDEYVTPLRQHHRQLIGYFTASTSGRCNVLATMRLGEPLNASAVIKVPDGGFVNMQGVDMGLFQQGTGSLSTGAGVLYNGPPGGPVPPTSPRQTYTWEQPHSWVQSYRGGGAWMSNTNSRGYQGYYSVNGNQFAHFGFPNVSTMLSGATVNEVWVYLYYPHWWFASGGIAVIGTHNNASNPGGANASGGSYNRTRSGDWPRAAGRWVNIKAWASDFQSGAARGITVGPGDGTDQKFYGYATECRLKIVYTK